MMLLSVVSNILELTSIDHGSEKKWRCNSFWNLVSVTSFLIFSRCIFYRVFEALIQVNRISQVTGVGCCDVIWWSSRWHPPCGHGWCGVGGNVATQFGTQGQVSTHDQTRIKLLQGSSISANVRLPQGRDAPLGVLLLCSDGKHCFLGDQSINSGMLPLAWHWECGLQKEIFQLRDQYLNR